MITSDDLTSARNVKELALALSEICDRQARKCQNLLGQFDYIVCGSGSSGSVVARRLAEHTDAHVLLIEAGSFDAQAKIFSLREWYANLRDLDWGYVDEPNAALNGRSIKLSMGKALGGGSSVNAMIWARGHKNDFDAWAAAAQDPAWNYENVLKIYRRIEDWQGPLDPKRRGRGGLLWVEPPANPSAIAEAMIRAAQSIGIPSFGDQNGEMMEGEGGCALANLRTRNGHRLNLPISYIYPVMDKPNLTVLTDAQVLRVVLAGSRAKGIVVRRGESIETIYASKEIILSMGAMQTPHVLMLSGIGHSSELSQAGVATEVHLPGVGKGFQDHALIASCTWEAPAPIVHTDNYNEATFFWKSDQSLPTPDIQPFLFTRPHVNEINKARYGSKDNSWSIGPGLVQSNSRGALRVRSADPDDKVIIESGLLSDEADLKALRRSIELVRELGNSEAMRSFVKSEVMPGPIKGKELDDFIRNGAGSYGHPTCSCRMGRDDMSVVDHELKVYGVDGLRIADGSIMPGITAGNTMAPCVVIGERMAELLGATEMCK